jgi:GNAT superfamily N-acetyltransferase
MIARVDEIAPGAHAPEGVVLREVQERRDFDRIEALENAVWGRQPDRLAERLEAEREVDPDGLAVVVAETEAGVVCAGWARFESGTEFATLWGGSTLPAWRKRGVYRSVVARRARLASQRGCRYIEVDASPASRPILERLGFVAVVTTTPFIWSPDQAVRDAPS